MSDLPLTDDELLSSAIDGELASDDRASIEERLRVEPALAERMAALQAAQELAATPVVPLATANADQLIAKAIAAAHTLSKDNVTDLAAARAKRTWRNRAMAVAASAAVLALAIPAIGALNDDTEGDFSAAEATSTADSDTTSPGDESGQSEAAPLASAAVPEADSFEDPQETTAASAEDGTHNNDDAFELEESDLQQPMLFAFTAFDPLEAEIGPFNDADRKSVV